MLFRRETGTGPDRFLYLCNSKLEILLFQTRSTVNYVELMLVGIRKDRTAFKNKDIVED